MNNNFLSVRKLNNINTQKLITNYLSGKNLNEFIHRIKMNIFDAHIKDVLKTNKIIETTLKFNKSGLNLYITFKDNVTEKAHISMHITGMYYSANSCGPYHIKIKDGITNKYGRKIESCSLIRGDKKKKDVLELKFIKKNIKTKKNISHIFLNNNEYESVLNVLNEYFDASKPLALINDISGKRDIEHPLFAKASNIQMLKIFYSKKPNLKKTEKRIKYKHYFIIPKYIKTQKSFHTKKSIPNVKIRKTIVNNKTGISYNIIKINKKTKKNIKHNNILNVRIQPINVTNTL